MYYYIMSFRSPRTAAVRPVLPELVSVYPRRFSSLAQAHAVARSVNVGSVYSWVVVALPF